MLCTPSWVTINPHHMLRCLATAVSDHCPLVVDCAPRSLGKRRFHFEIFWPKLDGFLATVDAAWNCIPPDPDPFRRIYDRMKITARRLQNWGARTPGNISLQLQISREIIYHLDMAQDTRPLSPAEIWLRRELKRAYLGLASLELAHPPLV